jgi:putative oxidoreductase
MALPVSDPAVRNEANRSPLPDPGVTPTPQSATDHEWGEGRAEGFQPIALLASRVLISQIFLISGVMKVMDPSGTMAQMEGRGMFWVPLFFAAATAVELAGGLSLLLGFKARLGALLLFLFLIPVTLTFHNWWTYSDPKEQHVNFLFFIHNLTLMGGLLLVMTFGAGSLSLDHWTRKGR